MTTHHQIHSSNIFWQAYDRRYFQVRGSLLFQQADASQATWPVPAHYQPSVVPVVKVFPIPVWSKMN